jgi:epoxyqueuosine reductase
MQAGMSYLSRGLRQRLDPSLLLPGVRSVIALAVAYGHPEPNPSRPGHGRISRYAWGDDYHDLLLPRVRALEAQLQALWPGCRSRGYVDTGPVMEKVWAQRAGLGWIGHNGCLITRRYGSWVFLALILIDRALAPDSPHPDRCGRCRACIPACSPRAILPGRRVDARRCISYTTIEHKGTIGPVTAAAHGDWVFGCDDCQTICPWNRYAGCSRDPAFAPRPALYASDLRTILRWSAADFRALRKRSPIARTKRRGILRNAIIALANSSGRAATAELRRLATEDPEELVRAQARQALAASRTDP